MKKWKKIISIIMEIIKYLLFFGIIIVIIGLCFYKGRKEYFRDRENNKVIDITDYIKKER